jgi:hypothetical protein
MIVGRKLSFLLSLRKTQFRNTNMAEINHRLQIGSKMALSKIVKSRVLRYKNRGTVATVGSFNVVIQGKCEKLSPQQAGLNEIAAANKVNATIKKEQRLRNAHYR